MFLLCADDVGVRVCVPGSTHLVVPATGECPGEAHDPTKQLAAPADGPASSPTGPGPHPPHHFLLSLVGEFSWCQGFEVSKFPPEIQVDLSTGDLTPPTHLDNTGAMVFFFLFERMSQMTL